MITFIDDPQKEAYAQSVATSEESTRCFFAALAYFGQPQSFNDIGCGSGHLVEIASRLEISSWGIDLNCTQEEFYGFGEIYQRDLTKGLGLKIRVAEMTFCLELAEHLPESKSDKLCKLLRNCTEKILVFSAAIPGQGGSGHVNEQPHEYWRSKLESRGFHYSEKPSKELGEMWKVVATNAWWYSQNVQVFTT